MQTNNLFSFQRFMMLCKQSLIINKKTILLTLAGFSGILFMILALSHYLHPDTWNNIDYVKNLIFLFFLLGIIYSGLSFPAFRSKEKSMTYLMLPASSSEKFVFEFLSRIIVFVILMPLLFWTVANLEGAVMHFYVPELKHYGFSFGETWSAIKEIESKFGAWATYAIIQGGLFAIIVPFTGAAHFSKSPLLKSMFTFSILVAAYSFYAWLLVKGFNLEAFDFDHENGSVLFIKNDHDVIVSAAVAMTVINLCLLSIAFFRLKEREV